MILPGVAGHSGKHLSSSMQSLQLSPPSPLLLLCPLSGLPETTEPSSAHARKDIDQPGWQLPSLKKATIPHAHVSDRSVHPAWWLPSLSNSTSSICRCLGKSPRQQSGRSKSRRGMSTGEAEDRVRKMESRYSKLQRCPPSTLNFLPYPGVCRALDHLLLQKFSQLASIQSAPQSVGMGQSRVPLLKGR